MRSNPERVAWTVMLSAFATFCLLAVGLPYSIWNYVTTATDVAQANVYANLGTLVIAGSPSIAVRTELSTTLTRENFDVASGERNQGGLIVSAPDGTTLAELTVYEQTRLTLSHMRAPRFGWSSQPYSLGFYLHSGQTRVQVREGLPRPISLLILTDFGQIALGEPGTYRIEVSAEEARVSVLAGQAVIACPADNGVGYAIQASGYPQGILKKDIGCDRDDSSIRNLIRNGDFSLALSDDDWRVDAMAAEGSSVGTISIVPLDGLPTVRFGREQRNWGLTQIEQTIDYNIVDKRSVILQMDFRIDGQSVDACGSQGTECPVMVQIYFEDAAGGNREWLQGFYAVDDPLIAGLPNCPPCYQVHDDWFKAPGLRNWQTFRTSNLIERLREAGFEPATINSIQIYASGHSFISYVRDVRLEIED